MEGRHSKQVDKHESLGTNLCYSHRVIVIVLIMLCADQRWQCVRSSCANCIVPVKKLLCGRGSKGSFGMRRDMTDSTRFFLSSIV